MIQTILSNRERPDLPSVSVHFPIVDYESVYKNLQVIGIGNVSVRDCLVKVLDGRYPILKRLEEKELNVDELDYLAKRLESFEKYERAQFLGAAIIQDIHNISDFIDLTFCCQAVTVIQDFTDLAAIGRMHYMDLYGGVTEEEMKIMDFQEAALSLILKQEGIITPYGVVYNNEMELEHCYDGLHFPKYRYSNETILTIAVTDRSLPEDTTNITWLYLPVEDCQIERALLRAGIREENIRLQYDDSKLPSALIDLMGPEENLFEINKLCACFQQFGSGYREQAEAALQIATPANTTQAYNLLCQIDLFDFIPDISTAEEYGKHMIMDSGNYNIDENLVEYIDFKRYGEQRMVAEFGKFTGSGYISYRGFISIEELMARNEMKCMGMMNEMQI